MLTVDRRASNRPAWEILDAPTMLCDGDRLRAWEQSLRVNAHTDAFYASPVWASFIAQTTGGTVRTVVARDEDGAIAGTVPLFERPYPLRFSVGNRVLVQKRLGAAEILGGTLALPERGTLHKDAIETIFSQSPGVDALYFDSVPTDSYFWRTMLDGTAVPTGCRLHIVDGPRPWHLVRLAGSFEDYLKTLASKPGARLRRDVRQLGKMLGGEAELSRITDRERVAPFIEQAVEVSRKSWQHRLLGQRVRNDETMRTAFEHLADRGSFRSYLLHVGDTACAFVIGYQHGGVYHYEEQAFDPAFAQHSPGAALLFLVLKDLHEFDRPDTLNFGVGDAAYKRRFGNWERSDASCLILRSGIGNAVLAQAHRLFTGTVREVKKLVGRKVAA